MGETNAHNELSRRINVCVAFSPSSMKTIGRNVFDVHSISSDRTALGAFTVDSIALWNGSQHESCFYSHKTKIKKSNWNDSIQATISFRSFGSLFSRCTNFCVTCTLQTEGTELLDRGKRPIPHVHHMNQLGIVIRCGVDFVFAYQRVQSWSWEGGLKFEFTRITLLSLRSYGH